MTLSSDESTVNPRPDLCAAMRALRHVDGPGRWPAWKGTRA